MAELSKVKIGGNIYDLKDADARSKVTTLIGEHAVEALGTAAWLDSVDTVAQGGTNLPTANAVFNAIKQSISELGGLVFKGYVAKAEGKTELESVEAQFTEPAAGWIAMCGVKEFIAYDAGEGVKWYEMGDESIYLTISTAAATYVAKTRTIAGISLENDITADQIKTALGLKGLAYKDSAEVTLTDYVTGLTGAEYTPEGTVTVALKATSTDMESTGSFTPAGSVSGKATAAGTVSIARDDENGVAVSGTVSAPTITVTPATATVQHIDSIGKLAAYTEAEYTAPSVNEAKSAFATNGVVASIDADDAEMLVFEAAATSQALTATGFDAGSYTPATYTKGELPTLGAEQTVVTGITSATASAPTFTGDKFGATFTGTEADITANFAGTAGAVTVNGNYDKMAVDSATFAGTAATIAPELVKGSKVITVE